MAFRDTDEQRSRGLPGVLRPSTASVRRTLLHWSASRMSRLPARIALVLVGLMSGHLGTASVVELASLTGGTRRTLERRLKRAGFAGAAVLLQIARVLYARDLALNLASSVECIAASAGFGSSRALRAACRRYASCSSSELSNPFHAERIGRQLVRALLPRPRG